MKKSTFIWALIVGLGMTFLACDRDNFDSGYTELYGNHEPFVQYDTTVHSFFRTASLELPLIRGEGSVERVEGGYFVQVRLTVLDSEEPFAMGWHTEALVPGEYEGAIFTINLKSDPQNPLDEVQINSGSEWQEDATFVVKVNALGDVGETITGTYAGEGHHTHVEGLVPFEGAFNVERVN